ncbi:MAG: hypothetical protein NVSMB53_05330 [Gemmatimonadaceae bacterium]
MHKTLPLATLALVLSAAPALAQQSPNTTPTTVTRVVLIHLKPGHADQFWADFRQHGKPVYDEEKRPGILTNYTVATKTAVDNPMTGMWLSRSLFPTGRPSIRTRLG